MIEKLEALLRTWEARAQIWGGEDGPGARIHECIDELRAILAEAPDNISLRDPVEARPTPGICGEPEAPTDAQRLREEVINKALERISFLTDSGDYHGYRSEVWIAVGEVYDTALRYHAPQPEPYLTDSNALAQEARNEAEGDTHADPEAELSKHICPKVHGSSHEMELHWVCETCGHSETADV
jgi:hypothetical protein